MATRQRRRSFLRKAMMPILASAFLTYFAYHAFHGEYGVFAQARRDVKLQELHAEFERLKKKSETLHNRVTLLRSESLDPDMIDELARANLNLVNESEITILRPEREGRTGKTD